MIAAVPAIVVASGLLGLSLSAVHAQNPAPTVEAAATKPSPVAPSRDMQLTEAVEQRTPAPPPTNERVDALMRALFLLSAGGNSRPFPTIPMQ